MGLWLGEIAAVGRIKYWWGVQSLESDRWSSKPGSPSASSIGLSKISHTSRLQLILLWKGLIIKREGNDHVVGRVKCEGSWSQLRQLVVAMGANKPLDPRCVESVDWLPPTPSNRPYQGLQNDKLYYPGSLPTSIPETNKVWPLDYTQLRFGRWIWWRPTSCSMTSLCCHWQTR